MPHTPGAEISNLPQGITVGDVYSDIMDYIMKNTRTFFENSTPNGAEIWSRLRETMTIVLTTPYGWDTDEHAVLRNAAVKAGLVDASSASLIQFVSEGEASMHFALTSRTNAWLEENTTFAVMDVGGSTVNIGVFECIATDPIQLREVSAGDSLQVCSSRTQQPSLGALRLLLTLFQAGGVFVNHNLETMLSSKRGPPFENPAIVKSMVEHFEMDVSHDSIVISAEAL
jgi:hypothetical protein